jgi:hypothetical protein
MKKLFFVVAATVLLGTGCSGMGNQDMSSGKGMMGMKSGQGMMDMKSGDGMMASMMMKMDTNGDGMLSKEEFMKGHEAMFDSMKGPNGMISLKDMQMKMKGMEMGQGGAMRQGGGMGQGQPMPGMK